MSLIKFQPRPHIPPIGFFEPISVDSRDMMTDVEYLLGILKKLNETIAQVNSNSQFIEEYSGKIEELESEIESLRQEMTNFESQINAEIIERFNAIQTQLAAEIAMTLIRANAYTDAVANRLETEIQNIAIGQIRVFDPTTGSVEDLQTVINNLYGTTRDDALTATEYDALELTATAYDAYQLTAIDYDREGKLLLV